jgi:hypothetical protein
MHRRRTPTQLRLTTTINVCRQSQPGGYLDVRFVQFIMSEGQFRAPREWEFAATGEVSRIDIQTSLPPDHICTHVSHKDDHHPSTSSLLPFLVQLLEVRGGTVLFEPGAIGGELRE